VIADPLGVKSYAFPSVAVNQADDVLVGFSSFSRYQYPSAAYSLRRAADPAGVIGIPIEFKKGLAPFIPSYYQLWGDTSATFSDVNDFWTIQQYAETQNSGVSRWGLQCARVRVPATQAPQLTATATGPNTVQLTWNNTGASRYLVYRTTDGVNWTTAGPENTSVFGTSLTDPNLAANQTYVYRMRGYTDAGQYSTHTGWSNLESATTIGFTDDPLVAGMPIKRVHMTELRDAVNAYRAAFGQPPVTWTDNPLPLLSAVRAQHLTELRSALNDARLSAGIAAVAVTTPAITPRASVIRAVHLQELRDALK
jgi:hypothetical protein